MITLVSRLEFIYYIFTHISVLVDDQVEDDGGAFLERVDGVEVEERVGDVRLAGHLPRFPVHQMNMDLSLKQSPT